MLLRLPIFFAKIDLKIKNIACLCFTQHPQFDSPPNWFVLYMFFEWQTPFMGNHGLISWNLLVKSIQSLEILQYDILKLPDAIHFIKTRVLPWKSSGVVSQMKVPPYLKKLRLCHDGADTSVVDEVVGAPIHLNSWELENSHIYQDANECLHFISRNRTPLPFVLVGLSCNLLLMVPVGFSDNELPHIICKHFRRNRTFLTVRITLCWPRRWFSKWPVCWCNVISRSLNWGILWTGCMANSCTASFLSYSTASSMA